MRALQGAVGRDGGELDLAVGYAAWAEVEGLGSFLPEAYQGSEVPPADWP